MLKSNYIKYISVSLLVSLMVGCQRPSLESKNNNAAFKSSSSFQQKSDDFNLLLSAYSDFKKSINKFNSQLKSFVNGDLPKEKVNFSEPNKKLVKLQEILLDVTKNSDVIKNNSELHQSIDDIDKTITDIAKVIQPLEKGLDSPRVVLEIQNLIDLKKNRGISPTGIFKTATQEELENFLSQRIKSLDNQFEQIKQISRNQQNSPINSNTSPTQISAKPKADIKDKMIIPQSELDNFYKRLNLTVTVASAGFIILGGLFAWLLYKMNMAERKQKPNNS